MRALAARPRCAVCGHLVDSFVEEEIFGRLRLTARCHGAKESVDLEPGEARGLVFAEAFRAPRALPPMQTSAPNRR